MDNGLNKFFVYFSELLGRRVVDGNQMIAGRISDIVMKLNCEIYPRAALLIIQRGFLRRQYAQISWEDVEEINDPVKVKINIAQIEYQEGRPKHDFMLCIDILDQQIVDVDNQKVVRVNDIHLLKVDQQLYFAHVDVGLRGLLRRLQWAGWVDALMRIFSPHSAYLTGEELISWKNAQVLTIGRAKNVLRLDVARQKLSQIPHTELAEIISSLGRVEKSSLFRALDVALQRKVFAGLATPQQAEIIDQLDDKEAAILLENIPSDDAADLLLKLRKKKTNRLMKLMETKTSKKLSKLLGFSKDSAGGLMTTEYLYLPQTATVSDAIDKLKSDVPYPQNIYHIYIVDDQHRLVGWTFLRRFINREPQTPIMETSYPQKIFVRTHDGMEKIALLLEKYKFSAIPVVNDDDVLQGIITIDDVLAELISLTWRKYKEKL